MSKKIILFLSDLKDSEKDKKEYRCPGGGTVLGLQTCEAPLRYLLGVHKDVSEILCIVTPVGQGTVSAVKQIVKSASQEADVTEAADVIEIPFADGEDFSAGPLAKIMKKVTKGDEILLELTGGLRDAIMQLLLTSRALSFSGVPTIGAVYSNYGTGEIVDCSDLIHLFDLLGGMQELASFGSVKTLRGYYDKQGKEPKIAALLDAMEGLYEDITLCRTGQIDQRIDAFNDAMDSAQSCSDPLVKALLPAFREKFGEELDVPGLIKWCVSSDMLQQALTLYRERIPSYLLERSILRVKENADPPTKREWWESKEDARFREKLLTYSMVQNTKDWFPVSDYDRNVNVSLKKLRPVLQDCVYIRELRNMVNHAGDGKNQKPMLNCLCKSPQYKRLDQVQASDIRKVLEQALKHLGELLREDDKPC